MDTAQHLDNAIKSLKQAYELAQADSNMPRLVLCAMRRQLRELRDLRLRVGATL